MQQPGVVTEYLDALARELSFDIPLSRRVRKEVHDHLLATAADDPEGDSIEAQRRAIARFGDAHEIARHYAASSLHTQTRRNGVIVVLVLTGILITMRGRGAWYGLMQWGLSDQSRIIGATVLSIDFHAFRIALIAGIIGWAYVWSFCTRTAFDKACRKRVRLFIMLCAATAGALLASVIADTILTGLHLFETKLSAQALVPVLSMGAEFAFMCMLIVHIRSTIRRAAIVTSLLSS